MTEVVEIVVTICLISGFLLLIIIAILKPRDFAKSIFIEFPKLLIDILFGKLYDLFEVVRWPFSYMLKKWGKRKRN